MSEASHNVEHLIATLGWRGRFQCIALLLVGFTSEILSGFNHVIMAFHGPPVSHTCKAGPQIHLGYNSTSWVQSNHAYNVQPYVTNVTHSECLTTVTYSDGQDEVIKCTSGQWEYFPQYGERNIVSEFDLVCSAEYLTSLATTIYFTGVMVGGLVFGDLADRFGRLPVMLFTHYSLAVVGLISAFSVNYTMFVCLRFITGIFVQGLQNSAFTLAIEFVQPQYRPLAGVVVDLFFSLSIMVLAGLAFGIRNWRHLQIVVSLIPLATLLYSWALPESLRWLVMKRKTQRAEKLLRRICKINKIPFPVETWDRVTSTAGEQVLVKQQYNLTHLFRTCSLVKTVGVSAYVWFVISATYYGLTFKVTSLSGHRYFNFFISGLFEAVVYVLAIPLMNRFGRKGPLVGSFMIIATMCLASGFMATYSSGLEQVITAFGLTGKIVSSCVFVIFYIYSSEMFPTVVRSAALGLCMVWARLGGLIAPQLNQWTSVLLGFDVIYLFGAMSLIGGLIVLTLPETHKRHLPDTFGEGNSFSNRISTQAKTIGLAGKPVKDDANREMLGTCNGSENV